MDHTYQRSSSYEWSFLQPLNARFKNAGIEVNRKMLADLAVHDEKAFAELATVAKNNIN